MDEIEQGGEKGFTPEVIFAALLSFVLIPLYIYCLPPVLPPYRDSGEMACAAWTLGVAHLVNGSVRRAGNRLRVTV